MDETLDSVLPWVAHGPAQKNMGPAGDSHRLALNTHGRPMGDPWAIG